MKKCRILQTDANVEPLSAFTKSSVPLRIVQFAYSAPLTEGTKRVTGSIARRQATGAGVTMAATGELIRLINYVDDITTTLRRISAHISAMEPDERKRLAESLRAAGSSLNGVVAQLEKGGQ